MFRLTNLWENLSAVPPEKFRDAYFGKLANRLGNVLLVGILGALLNIICYLFYGLYPSTYITCGYLGLLIATYFLNKEGHYIAALVLLATGTNCCFILINYADGLKAGKYLLYFTVIVAFSFITPAKKVNSVNLYVYLLTGFSIAWTIAYIPYNRSPWQHLSLSTYISMFNFNLMVSLITSWVFTSMFTRINEANEQALQVEIEKAEFAAAAKTRFLSNMSHELRTPLNGIIGVSNLLNSEQFLPHQRDNLQILRYSSEHMLAVVNDVLDFSKIEAGKMLIDSETVALNELLQRIYCSFEIEFQRKGIGLMTDFKIEPNLLVKTDATRLTQVLSNLTSNALKFTKAGSVLIAAHQQETTSDTTTVLFQVQDTGIGIPPDKMEDIFESFTQADVATTRKYGGTGLGLTISQKIMALMDSQIQVSSKVGVGSSFSFTLTMCRATQVAPALSVPQQDLPGSLRGRKVLIAEDNSVNMIIAKSFLSKWGLDVTTAENGLQAMERFHEQTYDLIMLDLEMPEMDGYQTIAAIRKTHASLPVLAFTAAVFDDIDNVLTGHGFSGYVQKPFQPSELHRKIESVTGSSCLLRA